MSLNFWACEYFSGLNYFLHKTIHEIINCLIITLLQKYCSNKNLPIYAQCFTQVHCKSPTNYYRIKTDHHSQEELVSKDGRSIGSTYYHDLIPWHLGLSPSLTESTNSHIAHAKRSMSHFYPYLPPSPHFSHEFSIAQPYGWLSFWNSKAFLGSISRSTCTYNMVF